MPPKNKQEKATKTFYSPESLTLQGEGVGRRDLLVGGATRTRITTRTPEGGHHFFVFVGGAEQSDGYEKGDRPPLVINEGKYAETGGKEGVAVLPYNAKTLKEAQGIFVGESLKLGAGDTTRDFGEVIQIDHVPSMGQETQLTPVEQGITRLFEQYEPSIAQLDQQYGHHSYAVTPPDVLP